MSKILPFGYWLRLRNLLPPAAPEELDGARTPPTPAQHGDHAALPWDWLFNASGEAVLILDALSERIVEGNPAAAKLLGMQVAVLPGSAVQASFDRQSTRQLVECLARARTEGRAQAPGVRGLRGKALDVTVSLFQTPAASYLLMHLAARVKRAVKRAGTFRPSAAFHAIDDASVGFLVADASLQVEYANRGFLKLVKLKSPLSIKGTTLVRWLDLSAAQLSSLREQLWSRRAIGDFVTSLTAAHQAPRAVQVSAVAVPDGHGMLWGFCVRELASLH